MSATAIRILVGSVIVTCLVAIGALEVLSERVAVDRGPTVVQGALDGKPDVPPAPAADLEFREEPGPSPAQLTAGRHTVLTVDPAARRFLSRTDTGRVDVSEVGQGALVVTDDTQGAGLAHVKPGDVIRVEAPNGQVQRIVVLRRGWRELESPEK